jgi:hypothetical protein
MNRYKYRAYYKFDGPSRAEPFRSEKSPQEIAEALSRFPVELDHYIDGGATVEVPNLQPDANSSHVTVVSEADRMAIDEAVKRCLNALDLYGDPL